MLTMNKIGFFPYTPATQMLHGLTVAIDMLHEEGLDNVFTRHARFAEATRRAVRTWGLEILCRDPKYYSPTVTAVLLPEGHDADKLRSLALDHFDISYGASFGKLTGKYFRIGHLGDTNDLTILGALAGTEMALTLVGRADQEGRRAGGDGLHRVGSRRGAARGGGVTGAPRRPMAFTLYDAPQSTCSQRVRFVLNAKGLAFEERKLDLLAGDQLAPEYLALNPNGVVPTLVHDGEVVIEFLRHHRVSRRGRAGRRKLHAASAGGAGTHARR